MPKHSSTHLHQSRTVAELQHIADNVDVLRAGSAWIRDYLARPHKDLGRTGSVCPFAQPALDQDTLRMVVVRLTEDDKRTQVRDAVKFHHKAFVSAPGTAGQRMLHATLMLFPDVSLEEAPDLIDGVKEELKGDFIEQGLMLGEFHANNESPGLHNPAFRPLRSSVPMLAIRYLVWSDIVFLNRAEYAIDTRLKYLQAYMAAPNISASNRKEAERMFAALSDEALKNHSEFGSH